VPNPEILWRSADPSAFPVGNDDECPAQPYGLAIPGVHLRESSSVADKGVWYAIGEAWAHVALHFMPSQSPVVLDIGCSVAKVARLLLFNPRLHYIGIDVFRPAIEWCQREFAHIERATFEHLDVHSSLYNPTGSLDAGSARLPAADQSVDMVIAASLFTHLLEPAFRHYLAEIRRCLQPGGVALISIHTSKETSTIVGDETRIDISVPYFEGLAAASGLSVKESVGLVYGQSVYVLCCAE
jgi:SAM-dependent methyltransferase